MQTMKILTSIKQLAADYPLLLLDLWGVVHNGVEIFPAAKECIKKVKANGGKVVFVSNAPRRSEVIAAQLTELGLAAELYDGVVSSGQLGRRALADGGAQSGLGRRCLHIGSPRDDDTPRGLGLEMVKEVAAADFILNSGPWNDGEGVADYRRLLDEAARRRVPMVCLNPDVEVIRGDRRMICAGALAKYLEEVGGEVYYHGKPYGEIYHCALELVGGGFGFAETLIIGDSLKTDIAGAVGVNCDSLLVLGGIHFNGTRGEDGRLSVAKLEKLLEGSPQPKSVIERLRW